MLASKDASLARSAAEGEDAESDTLKAPVTAADAPRPMLTGEVSLIGTRPTATATVAAAVAATVTRPRVQFVSNTSCTAEPTVRRARFREDAIVRARAQDNEAYGLAIVLHSHRCSIIRTRDEAEQLLWPAQSTPSGVQAWSVTLKRVTLRSRS